MSGTRFYDRLSPVFFHIMGFCLYFNKKTPRRAYENPRAMMSGGQYEKLFNRYCPASLVFDFSGLNAVEFIVEFL